MIENLISSIILWLSMTVRVIHEELLFICEHIIHRRIYKCTVECTIQCNGKCRCQMHNDACDTVWELEGSTLYSLGTGGEHVMSWFSLESRHYVLWFCSLIYDIFRWILCAQYYVLCALYVHYITTDKLTYLYDWVSLVNLLITH